MKIKYPLGIQTFAKIINRDLLYVDKTAIIYELIEQGSAYFFSRPRRFGKSLLISTLDALFSGQKELFNNLKISQTDYDFKKHPVIKLEFSSVDVNESEDLKQYIINATNDHASKYGIELDRESYEQRFVELVSKIYHQHNSEVVFLVDEYDKPILDNLFSEQLNAIKTVMNRFYAAVKSTDEYLRFVFITGVSKFAKVSVFSGMNHLRDISTTLDFSTLCGVTQQELEQHFAEPIQTLANKHRLNHAQTLTQIKYWYNGYTFEENAPGIYNPFSLLNLFINQKFDNYWYISATPTFLLDMLQQQNYNLKDLTSTKVNSAVFESSDPQEIEIQSLLIQTGYLTIKDYHPPLYQLDFPNYEVQKSFYDSVTTRYAKIAKGTGEGYIIKLIELIQNGKVDDFFNTLNIFLANVPYNISLKDEKYYQSLFYAILKLIGLTIEVEIHTNQGRIDCVIETLNTNYVIEFKLNQSTEKAIEQIRTKQYIQKYQGSKKPIKIIGVEFNHTKRTIAKWLVSTP